MDGADTEEKGKERPWLKLVGVDIVTFTPAQLEINKPASRSITILIILLSQNNAKIVDRSAFTEFSVNCQSDKLSGFCVTGINTEKFE